ncbi:MAG: TonB-dependent receptor plug domain-containing protein [Cyclobacteriaceae bacterium]
MKFTVHKHIPLTALLIFSAVLCCFGQLERTIPIEAQIQICNTLFHDNKFEEGLENVQYIHQNYFDTLNQKNQAQILELGIKLSFALDLRKLTMEYLGYYYEFSPSFTAQDLSQITPQLEYFVEEYIASKNEQSIYVNKHPQNIDLVPATVTVYTQSDIEQLGVRDLLDLIRMTPGFAELGDNNERVFGTRGTSSTTLQDVLFLINGHRITDVLTTTTAPDWISLNYIDQIEIVRGPGSALYGGNAFGGVVNIVTKTGRKKDFNNLSVNAGNGTSFQNLGKEFNSFDINYEWAKRLGNIEGIYLSATYRQSGGSQIDYAKTRQKAILDDVDNNTVLRPADLAGKEYINRYGPGYNLLLHYSRKTLQITANAQSSSFIYSRPSSLNLWYSQDQDSLRRLRRRVDKREFVQVEYDLLDATKFSHNELKLKLSADHFHKDFYSNAFSFGVAQNARLVGDEYRGTINLEFSSNDLFNNKNDRKGHFLFGVETLVNNWFYSYYTESNDKFELQSFGDQFSQPGSSRNEYIAAAYIQNEHHFIQDRLIATMGIRFNYHNEYSTFDTFKWGEQYSPRAALVFVTSPKSRLHTPFKFKLMYNSAFFPPPFLYRRSTTTQGIDQFKGIDNLRPQSIESGELVLFGDISPRVSYSLQRYINKINQFIFRKDDLYQNEPTQRRIAGFDLEIKYKRIPEKEFKKSEKKVNWSVFGSYSSVKQNNFKNSDNHKYFDVFNSALYHPSDSLSLFPKSYLNLGVNGVLKKSSSTSIVGKLHNFSTYYAKALDFGVNAQFIGSSSIDSQYFLDSSGLPGFSATSNSQDLPASIVVNAQIKLHWERFSLGASVFNLADKKYFLPSVIAKTQRQYGEGRMVYINLKYKFTKS